MKTAEFNIDNDFSEIINQSLMREKCRKAAIGKFNIPTTVNQDSGLTSPQFNRNQLFSNIVVEPLEHL